MHLFAEPITNVFEQAWAVVIMFEVFLKFSLKDTSESKSVLTWSCVADVKLLKAFEILRYNKQGVYSVHFMLERDSLVLPGAGMAWQLFTKLIIFF